MKFTQLESVMNDYAKYVIKQSKSNLTKDKKGGGALYNSLDYKVVEDNQAMLVEFMMEDYGVYVDRGVKGVNSTYPETAKAKSPFQYGSGTGIKGGLTKGIDQWLKQKKFRWRDDLGRFMTYKSMRYLIVKKIYFQGIKANTFFSRPFKAGVEKYELKLSKAFAADIESQMVYAQKI